MAKYSNPRQHWTCPSPCEWAISWDFVRERPMLTSWLNDPDFGLIIAAHIDEMHPEMLDKTPRSKLWRATLGQQLVGAR